jgi:RNA recognition motif-containing protein
LDSNGKASAGASEKAGAAAEAKISGKYVPPSMRGKMASGDTSSVGDGSRRPMDDSTTVRVTNLSEDTTEADVQALFKRFGPTSRIFLSRDRDTGICKGFAFVNYLCREDAARAIEVMCGYGFDNLILHVEWARYARFLSANTNFLKADARLMQRIESITKGLRESYRCSLLLANGECTLREKTVGVGSFVALVKDIPETQCFIACARHNRLSIWAHGKE